MPTRQGPHSPSMKKASVVYGGSLTTPPSSSSASKKTRKSYSSNSGGGITESFTSLDPSSTSHRTVFVDDSIALQDSPQRHSVVAQLPSTPGESGSRTRRLSKGSGDPSVATARSRLDSGSSWVSGCDGLVTLPSASDDSPRSGGVRPRAGSAQVTSPNHAGDHSSSSTRGSPCLHPRLPMVRPPPMSKLSSRHSSSTSRIRSEPRVLSDPNDDHEEDEDEDEDEENGGGEDSNNSRHDNTTPAAGAAAPAALGVTRLATDARNDNSLSMDEACATYNSESSESLPLQTVLLMPFSDVVASPIRAPYTLPRSTSAVSTHTREPHSGNTVIHQSGSSSRDTAPPSVCAARLAMVPTDHMDPLASSERAAAGPGVTMTLTSASSGLFAAVAEQSSTNSLVQLEDCYAADRVGSFGRALEESREAAMMRASQSSRRTPVAMTSATGLSAGTSATTGLASSLGASGTGSTTPFSSNLPWAVARAAAANASSTTPVSSAAAAAASAAGTHGLQSPQQSQSRPVHLSPLRQPAATTLVPPPLSGASPHSLNPATASAWESVTSVPANAGHLARSQSTTTDYTAGISSTTPRPPAVDIAELDALRLQLLRELRNCKEQMRRQQKEVQTLRAVACAGRKPHWDTLGPSAGAVAGNDSFSAATYNNNNASISGTGLVSISPPLLSGSGGRAGPLESRTPLGVSRSPTPTPPPPPHVAASVEFRPESPPAAAAPIVSCPSGSGVTPLSPAVAVSGSSPSATVLSAAAMTPVAVAGGAGDNVLSMAELDAFERRVVQLVLTERSAFGSAQPAPPGLFPAAAVHEQPSIMSGQASGINSPTAPEVVWDTQQQQQQQRDLSELPIVLARGISDFSTLELLVSNPTLRPVAMRPVRERWAAFKRNFTLGEDYLAARSSIERTQRWRENEQIAAFLANGGAGGGSSQAFGLGSSDAAGSSLALSLTTAAAPLQPPSRSGRTSPTTTTTASTQNSLSMSFAGSPTWRTSRHNQQGALSALTSLVRRVEKMKDKEVMSLFMKTQPPTASSSAF